VPFFFFDKKENMNKLLVVAVLLSGCAQLQHGATQPVVLKDAKNGIYFTTCSGAVEDWGSCHEKARNTCVNGYEVAKSIESPVGGRRELTFQCKK